MGFFRCGTAAIDISGVVPGGTIVNSAQGSLQRPYGFFSAQLFQYGWVYYNPLFNVGDPFQAYIGIGSNLSI